MTNRLVDYFVVVGLDENINPLTHPDDVVLEKMNFKPSILDRYPEQDYPNAALSKEVYAFCMPEGVQVSEKCELPSFFSFVLTGYDGNRQYGACLLFYEILSEEEIQKLNEELEKIKKKIEMRERLQTSNELSESDVTDKSTDELELEVESDMNKKEMMKKLETQLPQTVSEHMNNTKKKRLFITKSFCLISHWPLYSVYKAFLSELYRVSITPGNIPIERYIQNFVTEVPLPPPGRIQVQCKIGIQTIYIQRPPENQLPLADVQFVQLFQSIKNIHSIVYIFSCILFEKQILFHSKHYALLGNIAEAFCSFIYPFYWYHVYIPLLPKSCVEFIQAPVPYIMGCHTSTLESISVPKEVVRVDLDNSKVISCLKLPKLPERPKNKLIQALSRILLKYKFDDRAFDNLDRAFELAPAPDEIDHDVTPTPKEFPTKEVRFAFFRFFVSIFQKYRNYLEIPKTTDFDLLKCFKKQQFIKDQHESSREFFNTFLESQAFQRFILQRVTGTNPHEIRFFDESIDQKLNRSRLKLYKKETPFLKDESLLVHKTVVALSPDRSGIPENATYFYKTFPRLNPANFSKPRKIEHLVSEVECNGSMQGKGILSSWKKMLVILSALSNQQITRTSKQEKKFLNRFGIMRGSKKSKHNRTPSIGIDFTGSSPPSHSKSLSFDNVSDHQMDTESLQLDVSEPTGTSLFLDNSTDAKAFTTTFSKYSFETSDTCPNCKYKLTEAEIRSGWTSNPNDYVTVCPQPNCNKRFVPRFSVKTNEKGSSQNVKYEYLSPVVLTKEVENLLKHEVSADEKLFLEHPVIFWNLILHFQNIRIPIKFLFPNIDWNKLSQMIVHSSDDKTVKTEEIILKPMPEKKE